MTVYVDNMLRPASVRGARPAKWSHMFADSPGELEAFARQLGLNPSWIQHPGTHREHYDVTMTVRSQAFTLGAKAITYPADVMGLIESRRAVCQCKHLAECTWAEAVNASAA